MATQPDDGDYLRRFTQGDMDAFAALYRRYCDRVYGFAYRMLWEKSLSEDVTQECFLTLLKEPQKFDSRRASLLTFLCSIARNRILLHLRERPMKGEAGEEVSDIIRSSDDDPLHVLMGKELDTLVRQAVLSLPPLQREVLVLREYEELSYEEIASVVGADLGAVKMRLHRARQGLTSRLKPILQQSEGNCYEMR